MLGSMSTDSDTKHEEIKSILDELNENIDSAKSLIGSTKDTGGTTTAGTEMAKLNKLLTINTSHGTKTFTSSGTWTCPEGVSMVYVTAVGGGGGGGGGAGASPTTSYSNSSREYITSGGGGGGGGGGQFIHSVVGVTAGTSYSVTIGAAGSAGTAGISTNGYSATVPTNGGAGGNGGTTKFGNLVAASGGGGGGGGSIGIRSNNSILYYGNPGAGGAGTGIGEFITGMISWINGVNGISGTVGGVASNYGGGNPVSSVSGGAKTSGYMSVGYGGAGGASGAVSYNGYYYAAVNASAGAAGGKGKLIITW